MIPAPGFFEDIHAHGRSGPRTLTSVEPGEAMDGAYGDAWYSVGLHPWNLDQNPDYTALDETAADPRVAAIGETGLDANRGPAQEIQEASFAHHATLAERLGKPLIIHCVGRYGRIMELRKELKPSQRWIIHGFRGKPELARQLIAAGFDISLGERFNPGVPSVVPAGRLFAETDTSERPIAEIRRTIFKE